MSPAKEAAPSTELREWFGPRPERWDGFTVRYVEELEGNNAVAEFAAQCAARPDTVLLFGARNEQENEAVVLRNYLLGLNLT